MKKTLSFLLLTTFLWGCKKDHSKVLLEQVPSKLVKNSTSSVMFCENDYGAIYTIKGDVMYYNNFGNIYKQNGTGIGTPVGTVWSQYLATVLNNNVIISNDCYFGTSIYAFKDDYIYWYRHQYDGADGYSLTDWYNNKQRIKQTPNWSSYSRKFASDNGVIYGIEPNGDLYWHKHYGFSDGTVSWSERKKVGYNWNQFILFFSANNSIYAMKPNGDLYQYTHIGRADGSNTWANGGQGIKVGTSWNVYKNIIGSYNLIYGIDASGNVYKYVHLGQNDFQNLWENNGNPVLVGTGFNYYHF